MRGFLLRHLAPQAAQYNTANLPPRGMGKALK